MNDELDATTAGPLPRHAAEELRQRRLRRGAAARRINLQTAHAFWTYEQILDPYGDYQLSPEEEQVGRCFWLFDPEERIWITEEDVQALHADLPGVEWRALVRAALARQASEHPPPPAVVEFDQTVGRALGYGLDGYRVEPEAPRPRRAPAPSRIPRAKDQTPAGLQPEAKEEETDDE